MGFLMQMVSLIAQNSVQQKDMGVASSARMFFQQIGGSLGVAAFGAIFARRLTSSLAAAAGSGVHISASGGQLDPATVNSLPAVVKHDVFFAIAHADAGRLHLGAAGRACSSSCSPGSSRRSRCAAGRAPEPARPPASRPNSCHNRGGHRKSPNGQRW